MIEFREGGVTVRADAEATRKVYAAMEPRDRNSCDCEQCVHFFTNRSAAYRPPFRAILDRLGIDTTKESDLCGVGDPCPDFVLYLGSFDFVGSVERDSAAEPLAEGVPYGEYRYYFSAAPLSGETRIVADRLGVGPIASIVFALWLPVPFTWDPDWRPARD